MIRIITLIAIFAHTVILFIRLQYACPECITSFDIAMQFLVIFAWIALIVYIAKHG